MALTTLQIDLWDAKKKQWRQFAVIPYEPNFKPRCGNNLHQFWPTRDKCACGGINLTVEGEEYDGRRSQT